MVLLLIYALTLLLAVLISGLAKRSVLSTAVLFLAAGFLLGSGLLGRTPGLSEQVLQRMAELALFAVLFTDGMRTGGVGEIRRTWHLPGRALLIGMPLTILGIALLAHFLVKTSWPMSFLIGSALSPTDPVFVAAIFDVEAVPARIKHLLNVESGLNDGLALPLVVLLLSVVSGRGQRPALVIWNLVFGVLIGVAIPWIGIRLEESRFFEAVGLFQPLNAFALGLLVLAVAYATGANLFLAAFAAGVSVASFSASVKESFERFGELIAELLKLAAVFVFGALIAPHFFQVLPFWSYVFVGLAVFAVRPIAIWLALARTELDRHEILTVGWFGPKGFASVVYGLMILAAGNSWAAHLIALAIAASIVVYSSSDILIGRWFQKRHAHSSPAEAASPTHPG